MSHWGNNRDTRDEQRKRENGNRLVKVRGLTVLALTDKAILVTETETMPNGPRAWVPMSQIKDSTPSLLKVDRDDAIEFSIPKWLAQEKEFLYE